MGRYFYLLLTILTISCVCNKDVSNNPDYNFGYQKGQIYLTKLPLFLTKRPTNYLVVPGKSYPSLDKYLRDKNEYNDLKGVFEKSGKILIVKLNFRETFEDSYLIVYGKLLNGEYEGEMVNLTSISKWLLNPYPMFGSMTIPDPEILELEE